MKNRLLLTVFLLLMTDVALCQNNLFVEAFEEFSTRRLWEYEEIPLKWKMDGMLQADLNEGLNRMIEGMPALADSSFSTVLLKDSTIWQAYYYRAASRKKLGKHRLAIKDLERAIALNGDFYEGFVELGKVYYLSKRTEESEDAINKAIRLDRTRGVAYYVKGDIDMAQDQLRLAAKNYRDCLEADSLFHDARIKLSLLDLFSKKDEDLALKRLNDVLKYDSLQKTALLFRALLMYGKDKSSSVKNLSSLISVNPTNVMAMYMRGVYLAELGQYYRAFSDFHKVLQTTSTSDNNFVGQQTWLDKKIDLQNVGAYTVTRVYGLDDYDGSKIKEAYCHILLSKFDKSLEALEAVRNQKTEPLVFYLKGVAFEHKGDHIKALNQYHMALQLDNEIADAHKKRGIYEQELKQWQQSVADFSEVLRITPDAFVLHRMRGVSYYHLNQFKKAIEDFNVYLKQDSTNTEVISFRGMALVQDGQRLKGYIDLAISENPQAIDFIVAKSLIDSLLNKKDTTFALHALEVMTNAAPHFTEGYVRQLKVYLARKDWKKIGQEITNALRNSRMDAREEDHSFLLTLAGMNYGQLGHKEDAITSLTQAIKFDKKNALAYYERGKLLIDSGKASRAEADLKQAATLGHPEAKTLLEKIKGR